MTSTPSKPSSRESTSERVVRCLRFCFVFGVDSVVVFFCDFVAKRLNVIRGCCCFFIFDFVSVVVFVAVSVVVFVAVSVFVFVLLLKLSLFYTLGLVCG